MTTDTHTRAEDTEATARRKMAEAAAMPAPRGWDTRAERARMLAEVDAALDAYNEAANTCEAQTEGPERRDGRADTMRCHLPRGHVGSHDSGDGRWWIAATS